MSWRRGFFRLWIVASVIWIASMGVVIGGQYRETYRVWERYAMVPLKCSEAKGIIGKDYGYHQVGPGDWDRRPADARDGPRTSTCWMPIRTYQLHHPDLAGGLGDDALLITSHAEYGMERRPFLTPEWQGLAWAWAGISVAVPLLVLAIGAVIAWVLSGFRSRPTAI